MEMEMERGLREVTADDAVLFIEETPTRADS